MKTDKERRRFLKQELKEYEKTTAMTDEERSVLHEWVRAGNSVHENASMAVYEGGRPMDTKREVNISWRNTALTGTG